MLHRLKAKASSQPAQAGMTTRLKPVSQSFPLHRERHILITTMLLDVLLHHTVTHIPTRNTKVPSSPKVPSPKLLPNMLKLSHHHVRTLPLQPLHQPADRYLRCYRHEQMHMILRYVSAHDLHVFVPTNLPNQFPHPFTNNPFEHAFTVLGCPNQVQMNLKDRMRSMPVAHQTSLRRLNRSQKLAEAFARRRGL